MMCAMALTLKQERRVEPGPLFVMLLFVFAGFSVLFRSIEIDNESFSKQFLWTRRKILWSDASDLIRLKNGTYALAGESKYLPFDRRYADLEIMILEIVKRLNEKRMAEMAATEASEPLAERGDGNL